MGCSVQSRQMNLINEIRGANSDPFEALEDAMWYAQWNNEDYTVYAINASESQTLFGYDSRLLLSFNGWNLTDVIGFLPDEDVGRIEVQSEELLYFLNGRLLARHKCEPWVTSEQQNGGILHYQACEGREPYANEIDINSEGMVTRLHYLLHPEYPQLTLKPANNDD